MEFRVSTQYTPQARQELFFLREKQSGQYQQTQRLLRIVRFVVGIPAILLSTILLLILRQRGGLETTAILAVVFMYLCGIFLLLPKEKLYYKILFSIQAKDQIETVQFTFTEEDFALSRGERVQKFAYSSIDWLSENESYFVLGTKVETCLLDKKQVTGGTVEAFQSFLQGKTGLCFSHQ